MQNRYVIDKISHSIPPPYDLKKKKETKQETKPDVSKVISIKRRTSTKLAEFWLYGTCGTL